MWVDIGCLNSVDKANLLTQKISFSKSDMIRKDSSLRIRNAVFTFILFEHHFSGSTTRITLTVLQSFVLVNVFLSIIITETRILNENSIFFSTSQV